jgi:hypothetical protein
MDRALGGSTGPGIVAQDSSMGESCRCVNDIRRMTTEGAASLKIGQRGTLFSFRHARRLAQPDKLIN